MGGLRNCISKGPRSRSHVQVSVRRPTTLKRTHTTTTVLITANTYKALTIHVDLAGKQFSMGLTFLHIL